MSAINHAAPNTMQNVPGAQALWTHRNNVMFNALNMPAVVVNHFLGLAARGEKVKHYIPVELVNSPARVDYLEALRMCIEIISGTRTYVHFIPINGAETGYNMGAHYRIGPMKDAADLKETSGHLVMGRGRDGLVTNPQNFAIYFRDNGVPPQFATTPSPAPAPRRTYPIFPYVNKKGKLITKTGKPRNGWIIYRASRHDAVKLAYPERTTAELSTIIQEEWQNMDVEIKQLYSDIAQAEKLSHFTTYPGYEVKPRKSSEIQKRRTITVKTILVAPGPDMEYLSDNSL
uniref:MAT1-1-3 n=1 Tax=Acephala applanata TaxID=327282 RepID=D9J2E2_9HELO|nr:MAT1-1-3 [Acephala applanata]ADJ38499.1 MAT1-1-3 [Acephala applanata]